MRLLPKLSRQARLRKLRQADNHKMRRHYHKWFIGQGYTAKLVRVDPNGRKHWIYGFSLPLRLERPGMSL
jgi:hypothetical protein